jgi:hypothetical protein
MPRSGKRRALLLDRHAIHLFDAAGVRAGDA